MRHILISFMLLMGALAGPLSATTHEVTYCIERYNSDMQDFVIRAFGQQPEGAVARFENSFGATYGNRYNQIPRNREAILWLEGFEGSSLCKVSLSICSNNKEGSFGLTLLDGEETLYKQSSRTFDQWYGRWVSKDVHNYVTIDIPLDEVNIPEQSERVGIRVFGGTGEGSVYLNAVTLTYDSNASVESPLGWSYEKLDKKAKLAAGDVIVLYRSGNAAADFDGIEKSHYLDVTGVNSMSDLTEPDVLRFTVGMGESGQSYTLTNQYGEVLGATKEKNLAWDKGVMTWNIELGFDGATISSTQSSYGTLKYNAPAGSYARFWNYASKNSLPLPYIYRRQSQHQPVTSTGMTMPAERTVYLSQDTIIARAVLQPGQVTDFRIDWSSSDTTVAVVRDGIVTLRQPGDVYISAASRDGGASAQMLLHVEAATGISPLSESIPSVRPDKFVRQGSLYVRRGDCLYDGRGNRVED